MALHFSTEEFDRRLDAVGKCMEEREFDALLLFAQESMYWLTGYDTFGFCFFQCMVVTRDGRIILLTRAPDLRQAQHTSIVGDIRIWVDQGSASPVSQLKDLLFELDLQGKRIGVEFDTHGLTGKLGLQVDECMRSFAKYKDASDMILRLRAVKSQSEVEYARKAAALADEAFHAGLNEIRPGADEGRILAAMQGKIFEGGGDYPGNEFIIGSGRDALLCRYKSGRRELSESDQITLEFAGVYRHYHSALMRTVILGKPSDRQLEMHEAVTEALHAVEQAMKPGNVFGDVFDAHAAVFDRRGLHPHRLNACGYSLGTRFTPSWMDWPMFYKGNEVQIVPNMTLFAHMILMDSENEVAVTLGRTYLTTEGLPESLSKLDLELKVVD